MSDPPSQQTPPRPLTSASTVPVEGYVMLPGSMNQPRPLQVVQGLDGMIYAVTTPPAASKATDNHIGSVSPNKSSSITQLSQLGASMMPHGLNFAAAPPPALLAAAAAAQVQAATAGAQVNVGALAAAAALQGQTPPSQFPFIPIYAPFSMSSSFLTQPSAAAAAHALSLQPVPLGTQATPPPALPGQVKPFTLPAQSKQQAEDIVKRPETAPSIQSLLAPGELLSSDRKMNQSRSVSSGSDCSPSPTVCKTEPFTSAWSKNNTASTLAVSVNKDIHSPTLVASNYSSLDLLQRGVILQRTAHDRPITPTQDNVSKEQTRMDTNPGPSPGLQNVKSLSSLSRYVNQPSQAAQTKQGSAHAVVGAPSLEKLLQAKPEPKESAHASASSLHGKLTGVSDDHSAMLALLQDEPHLLQFYEFFCQSHLSKHLRIRLLTTEGGANVLKWIEVTRQASHIDPSFGPVDAARIVISSNGLCKLQLMFPYSKTMSTRFVPTTMAQADELFSELSPKHVVCPGLLDCETKLNTLGYQPTNIRIVETPSLKRYDHEKCPVWHIPLPCNLYSECGQILHHMCKQCKNLLSTLNKTITKIAGLNAGVSKNHELPYDFTVMSSSRPASSGLSSPPYLLRPLPGGKAAGGTDGAKETHGRKRKRRAHSKDEDSSGSAVKSSGVLPEIYQLLWDPTTVTAPQSTPSVSLQESTCTPATSSKDSVSVSASKLTSNIATPSSVIVQVRSHQQSDSSIASSDSTAGKSSGGKCNSPESDSELVQTDEPKVRELLSKNCCSGSPDNNTEVELSTPHSHAEGEVEQEDVCSSPSPAEDLAASNPKKQKFS